MTRLLTGLAVLAAVLVAVVVGLPLTAALTLTAAAGATSPQVEAASPPVPAGREGSAGAARAVLAWADRHAGDVYRMGAYGPHAWDCSSFSRAAWAQAGVHLPRTAQAQRDWLAAGHGARVVPGHEQPGDLVFWDSYLGPRTIGHVALVQDPAWHSTIDARSTRLGVGHFTYQPRHHIFEIWRPLTTASEAGNRDAGDSR